MNDDSRADDDDDAVGDEIETGEAVRRVSMLMLDPSPDFGDRLKRRIDRRVLGNDLLDLSFSAWAHGFMQYLMTMLGLAKSSREDKGG